MHVEGGWEIDEEGEAAFDHGVVDATEAEGGVHLVEVGADAAHGGGGELASGAAGSDFDGHAGFGAEGEGLADVADDEFGAVRGDGGEHGAGIDVLAAAEADGLDDAVEGRTDGDEAGFLEAFFVSAEGTVEHFERVAAVAFSFGFEADEGFFEAGDEDVSFADFGFEGVVDGSNGVELGFGNDLVAEETIDAAEIAPGVFEGDFDGGETDAGFEPADAEVLDILVVAFFVEGHAGAHDFEVGAEDVEFGGGGAGVDGFEDGEGLAVGDGLEAVDEDFGDDAGVAEGDIGADGFDFAGEHGADEAVVPEEADAGDGGGEDEHGHEAVQEFAEEVAGRAGDGIQTFHGIRVPIRPRL